jgi:hypothetical protein
MGFDGHAERFGDTDMIVVLEEDTGLALRRVRWRDHVLVRARASALDDRLAAGESPESTLALALHAERLCRPAQRRLLARSLSRLVAAADDPAGRPVRTPVCRPAVRQARAELAAIAGRLSAAGPVSVHGVARVRTLLADGTGPLYQPAPPGRLLRALEEVRRALDALG